MLVLNRKIGEEIHIGDDTVVFVQSIAGNRVRLGVQAPRETLVLRGELKPLPVESNSVGGKVCEVVAEKTMTKHRPRRITQ